MEANAAAGVDDAVAELEQKAKTYEEREAKGRDMLVTLERLREETLQKTKDLLLGAEENEVEEWGKKIRSKRKEINEVEEQLLECSRTKADINNFLSGEVTCPSCGEKFVPNSNIELTHDEAVEAKKQIEAQEKSLNELLEKKNHNLTIYKNKKEKAESAAEDYRKLQLDLRNFDRDIQEQKDAIDSYHKRAKRARTDAVALRDDTTWKKQLDDLRSKIAEAERQLKLKSKDLKPIEEEISMLRFWKYNMGRSGFQTYLANKSVSIIEGATNSYLERFGVDIRVRISGFKVLKSGDVREKIDVFVSNDGINWSSFMGKSGGERGRVTLAGVLGIQRLINMSTGGRGLDLMLFDECFHGMDGRGQENIIKVFEKMGSTIMVITQDVSEGFNNENTLIVVKEGGESRYL